MAYTMENIRWVLKVKRLNPVLNSAIATQAPISEVSWPSTSAVGNSSDAAVVTSIAASGGASPVLELIGWGHASVPSSKLVGSPIAC